MQHMSLPRFGPSHGGDVVAPMMGSSNNNAPDGQSNLASFLFGPSSDEGMDFDLLAEYLLDEPSSAPTGAPNSFASRADIPQVATPESSEIDGSFGAPTDSSQGGANDKVQAPDVSGDLAQVQQIIAEHASKVQFADNTVKSTTATNNAASTSLPPQPQITVVAGNRVTHSPHVVTAPVVNSIGFAVSNTVYQPPGAQMVAAPQGFAPHVQMSQVALQHPGTIATAPVTAPAAGALQRSTSAPMSGSKRTSDLLGFDFSSGPSRRRPKSEAQVNRRRERNRILARRTRLRKKFFFESLQKEVMDLQRENNALKLIVRSNLDQSTSKKILQDTKVELPEIVLENCGDASELDRQDFSLIKSLQGSQQCFVITDPSLHDNPIVYASAGFLSLTGYSRDEVLGRNCRFLQGTETDVQKVDQIRKAISVGEDVSVCMVNYGADGVPFWNQLFIAALRDAYNNIVNFVGVLVRVAGPSPDDPEYGKTLGNDEEGIHEDDAQAHPTEEASNHALTTTGEG